MENSKSDSSLEMEKWGMKPDKISNLQHNKCMLTDKVPAARAVLVTALGRRLPLAVRFRGSALEKLKAII